MIAMASILAMDWNTMGGPYEEATSKLPASRGKNGGAEAPGILLTSLLTLRKTEISG